MEWTWSWTRTTALRGLLPAMGICVICTTVGMPSAAAELVTVSRAIPTGDARTRAIKIRKQVPREEVVGRQEE